MADEFIDVCVEEVDQYEDLGVDPGLSQDDAFVHGGNGQPSHAGLHQRARNLDGAVAIGIGLDDGHEAAVRPEALADLREIIDECGEVDAGVGRVLQG